MPAICRFAEPIASTSLFPYLPEMIKSFNVREDEIGKWAGLCSAMFSVCQAIMGIPWGIFSDRFGRKPAILLGLVSTMVTSLMWGFSTTLGTAIVARGLAGAGNGNVGIIRTTVAEMVPFKELQPRAFSLMPLVWNTGSIFGPTIGGALANPYNVEPGERGDGGNLLQRFPYALPNIVAATIFLVGITTGFLFLHETLETMQDRRDFGLELGRKLTGVVKSHVLKVEEFLHLRKQGETNGEQEPLLNGKASEDEDLPLEHKEPPPPAPKYSEVLNKQAVLNLVVYTLLALHNMAFDQLLPVYMDLSPLKTPPSPDNPLKFAGGFGLSHFKIGLITTCYGIAGMLIQFILFPPVARRFGVLNCLKVCGIAFPIAYFLTPFTALLPTTKSRVGCMFAVMMIKCFCSIFAFPCSTILLTNSASSLRVLGTLNGFATSTSAIGRAIGPFIGGLVFTAGIEAGYVIAPWWMFTGIGIIAAIPIFFLEEGEGFGGDDDHVSDEESVMEAEEQDLREEAVDAGAEAPGRPFLPDVQRGDEEAEEALDDMGPLSRATTMSMSSALTMGTEEEDPQRPSAAEGPVAGPSLTRRNSRRVMRKMSIPIGMGERGISRRYSSNLGQSLGSAASYNG